MSSRSEQGNGKAIATRQNEGPNGLFANLADLLFAQWRKRTGDTKSFGSVIQSLCLSGACGSPFRVVLDQLDTLNGHNDLAKKWYRQVKRVLEQ